MVHPLQKYEHLTKKEKEELIKALDEELDELHELHKQISRNTKLDLLLRNQLIRQMDDRGKDIYYERKLLTGRF